jgi:hypothetical protein
MESLNLEALSSAYMQYKQDTDFVAGWLAQMLMKCGYSLTTTLIKTEPDPKSTSEPVNPAGPRLKGKARQEAKDAAAARARLAKYKPQQKAAPKAPIKGIESRSQILYQWPKQSLSTSPRLMFLLLWKGCWIAPSPNGKLCQLDSTLRGNLPKMAKKDAKMRATSVTCTLSVSSKGHLLHCALIVT